jgi:hypothetical protein
MNTTNCKNPCGEIALPIGNNLPRVNIMSQLMSGDRSSFYAPYMPMPVAKYKFSRSNWYEADLPRPTSSAEVLAWCTDQFGPHPVVSDAWSRWYYSMDTLYFRDKRDYIWFTLRWSS